MTQIRLLAEAQLPGTHALIIGVGHYQHLRGGPSQRKGHLGLNVLRSPPISAMRLARWLIDGEGAEAGGLSNPQAPLTTIDVLVSAEQAPFLNVAEARWDIERASLPTVRAAFDRWLVEVQRHPDNVGILYFCGHGVMGNGPEQFLLLDDHGEVNNRPFETGSFDLSNTLRALSRQVEAQLYVFIDACRTHVRSVADRMAAGPTSLLDEGASSENINRGTTCIFATGENMPAFGDRDGTSRFTEALLQALGGYSGMPQPGTQNWHVNGGALAQAMPKLLHLINREWGGAPQACTPYSSGAQDAPLHVAVQIPKVKVEIELSPEAQRLLCGYSIHNLGNRDAEPITGGRTHGIWSTVACKGVYRIQIAADKPFAREVEYFEPPHYHLAVEVET